MTTPPRRRPEQNTGRRAKTMKQVEDVACPDEGYGGNHSLINYSDDQTRCMYCDRTWADLDAALNHREASWL
jgi:5-methylcytosine-specific restriction endonuclease McrA